MLGIFRRAAAARNVGNAMLAINAIGRSLAELESHAEKSRILASAYGTFLILTHRIDAPDHSREWEASDPDYCEPALAQIAGNSTRKQLTAEIVSIEYLFHSMVCAWCSIMAAPRGIPGRLEAWKLLSPTMLKIKNEAYLWMKETNGLEDSQIASSIVEEQNFSPKEGLGVGVEPAEVDRDRYKWVFWGVGFLMIFLIYALT